MIELNALLEWIGNASLQLLIAAAIAWLLCVTVARKSPALRHAIWVVVLLKCFVPPSVTAPWSLSQLWIAPPVGQAPPDAAASDALPLANHDDGSPAIATKPNAIAVTPSPQVMPHQQQAAPVGQAPPDAATSDSLATDTNAVSQPTNAQPLAKTVTPALQARPDLQALSEREITAAEAFQRWWMRTLSMASLMFVWVGGATIALTLAALSIVRVTSKVRRGDQIDEGPAAIAIEEAALQLGLKSPPRLVATDDAVTPFVAGLFQPTVVIPRSIFDALPADELRLVIWHEVVHVARRDAWTSLLQLFSVAAFWFHPAVWWAAAAVRREREACCDETVLRTTQADPSTYGDAFLHVLSAVRGRAIAVPAWAAPAGVFERDSDLRSRIEQIMSFRPTPSKRLTVGLVATLFALAVVPMGVRANDPWAGVEESDIPSIVSMNPSVGATDVDPEISEIKVTFDRPMSGGFSWTGSGPTYPPTPDGLQPSWSDDKKTCTLPVALEAERFYRIGVNSKSHQNFRSANGVPVKPTVLTFTTRGANKAAVGRMAAPKIVAIDPPNGATDVHPLTTREIRVTFDRPMNQGMSWTGSGEKFPKSPDDAKPRWLSNSRTCVFPVQLSFGRNYRMSLNSDRFNNFQSTAGVSLEPIDYTFTTVSKDSAAVLWSSSFEDPFSDPDAEGESLYAPLRSTEDASEGNASLKLREYETPFRQPVGTSIFGGGGTAYAEHDGTTFMQGELDVIPPSADKLEIQAMIRAEKVGRAQFVVRFYEHTPSAKAGKEETFFVVRPPGVDKDEDAAMEVLLIGRSDASDPPADHSWALYRGVIDIPERAEFANFSIRLHDGDALWVDELKISAFDDTQDVGQASPDAAASDAQLLAPTEMNAQSTSKLRDNPLAPSRQARPDLRGDATPTRPPSINARNLNDDDGLLFTDDFNWSITAPSFWKTENVQGVILEHRTDVGGPGSSETSSIELRKNIDGYFPIASWSHQLDHNDPTATHIQLTANIKADSARKAVLDVLFLDENDEWIRHQWADHIGDFRNEWLVGEERLAEGTDTTPEPNGVTHDWHPYGGAVAIPAGTKTIEISAQMYGPGTVFVDDVEVRYVNTAP